MPNKKKNNSNSNSNENYTSPSLTEEEIKKRLNETLADGYILKPFNFSDFNVIFEILNGKVK